MDDDGPVTTQKPAPVLPPPTCPSPPRQKPPPKPPCPPSKGSRTRADIHRGESQGSRDSRGKVASTTSTYTDYPNIYDQTPMVASAEIILNSPLAAPAKPCTSSRGSRDIERTAPSASIYNDYFPNLAYGQTARPRSPSLQGTFEEFSNVPQQGSSFSAVRAGESLMVKDNGSMLSQHGTSSHFDNVHSFTTIVSANVSATPHADQCPNTASGSTLNRVSDHASKQSREVDRERPPASPVVPDYPSPTAGTAPAVPSVQFQTPPLREQRKNFTNSNLSANETSEMHTPNLQRTGSEKCQCDHSTPLPDHLRQTEHSFSSRGATRGEGSPLASSINRLEDAHSFTGGYDTSHWDAGKTDV